MRQISYSEGSTHSWQVNYTGPLPIAPGDYNGHERYRHSGLSFAYLEVHVNTQNTIKGLEQKTQNRFGKLSGQKLHFMAHSV